MFKTFTENFLTKNLKLLQKARESYIDAVLSVFESGHTLYTSENAHGYGYQNFQTNP